MPCPLIFNLESLLNFFASNAGNKKHYHTPHDSEKAAMNDAMDAIHANAN
jgi:hypothetical protein